MSLLCSFKSIMKRFNAVFYERCCLNENSLIRYGHPLMNSINLSFIVSLVIITLGYLAKRFHVVKESDGDGLSRIVLNFTLPATVITVFSTIQLDKSLFLIPFINIMYCSLLASVAFFIFRKQPREEKGMLTMQFASFNIGLFAYPLIEVTWGSNGLKYFGMFDMGNSLMTFGAAYVIACLHSAHHDKISYGRLIFRALTAIPFLAYVTTLVLSVLHLSYPPFFLSICSIIAKANMPMSLLLLGIFLSFSFETKHWKRLLQILAVRYSLGISVGLLLYVLLPFDKMFRITLLLGFCLPISLSVVPYAVECGYDKKFVGTVNNATIVISFMVMWVGVLLVQQGIL